MNEDIIDKLKDMYKYEAAGQDFYLEAIEEIERLRSINRAMIAAYESLKERHRSYNNQQIGVLQRTIKELETKIGWYKAVNAQLRDDLIEANADFQALARTPAPTVDPLDAIVLGLKEKTMLDAITDLLIAIGTLWLLIIIMPLINTIRQDAKDPDITEDWADVRTAIRITHNTIIHKIRRNR